MATSKLRGHEIEKRGEHYVFVDDGSPVEGNWHLRPCGHCGLPNTPEGHDGCLGTLPGVMNACCGHGDLEMAYVQLPDRTCIRGQAAMNFVQELTTSDAPGA